MRKFLNNLFWVAGLIAILVWGIGGLYIRFTNLDVTTARLMVMYWKEYAALVVFIFLCLHGFYRTQ